MMDSSFCMILIMANIEKTGILIPNYKFSKHMLFQYIQN